MKKMVFPAILAFCAFTASLPALSQEHPMINPAARETRAKQLHSLTDHNGKVLVLDVRTPQEYAAGHVPGAVNVPINQLSRKIPKMKVGKDTTIVTMCDHGGRSSRAALELQKMGYHATSFCRIDSWKKDGYKVTKKEAKPSSE